MHLISLKFDILIKRGNQRKLKDIIPPPPPFKYEENLETNVSQHKSFLIKRNSTLISLSQKEFFPLLYNFPKRHKQKLRFSFPYDKLL